MQKTQSALSLLGVAAVGAAAMYLLDPKAGAERRQRLSEKAGGALAGAEEAFGEGWETLSAKASDLAARAAQFGSDAMGSRGSGCRLQKPRFRKRRGSRIERRRLRRANSARGGAICAAPFRTGQGSRRRVVRRHPKRLEGVWVENRRSTARSLRKRSRRRRAGLAASAIAGR